MKKVKMFLCLMIVAIMFVPIICNATDTQKKEPRITEDGYMEAVPYNDANTTGITDTVINKDVYEVNDSIRITRPVIGNVFLVGNDIRITSDYIDGSVYVIGNTIEIDCALITESIYLIGNTVTVRGEAKSVYSTANKFSLENANIYNNVNVAASDIYINADITKDLNVTASYININEKSKVNGNLTYCTDKKIDISESVISKDNVKFIPSNSVNYQKNEVKDAFVSLGYKIVTVLVIGLIMLFFRPEFIESLKTDSPVKKLFISAGIGFLVIISIPMVMLLLLITIVGAPLSGILLVAYILLLILCGTVANIVITSRLINKIKPDSNSKPYFLGILLLVTIAVWIIGKIPFIGWLGVAIVYLSGIGEIGSYIFSTSKKEKAIDNVK